MSIRIPKSRDDRNLLTISELIRRLDVPISRMKKAVAEGLVCPIGTIAHADVIALTDEEIESLRTHFHPLPAHPQTPK